MGVPGPGVRGDVRLSANTNEKPDALAFSSSSLRYLRKNGAINEHTYTSMGLGGLTARNMGKLGSRRSS